MKQVIQNYKTGKLSVEEVPAPVVKRDGILIRTKVSLISAGTERTKVETAQMNLVEKALSRLDLVKTVVTNIKQEGILLTLSKAFNKLNTPTSLGYSCAGEVIEAGEGTTGFKKGDIVACIGEACAAHAEINSVPARCAVKVPEQVPCDQAAFVGLGAIAMNAVGIAQVQKDETVAVVGLGLLGQLVAQIARARGCRVLGIEIDEAKLGLARKLGADAGANPLKDDIDAVVRDFTACRGVDAVIITAASRNNLPIELSGRIARNRGRVVLVGAMPIVIPRKDYYEKELMFVISSGFGADLYFPVEKGRRYPYQHVPVTMRENMQSFLEMVADTTVVLEPLITHRFRLEDAIRAYDMIRGESKTYLGIVFEYGSTAVNDRVVAVERALKTPQDGIKIGFIGAGSFAQGYMLPVLRRLQGVQLAGVAASNGINAQSAAKKFGFAYCTTDYREILADRNTDCVFIMTRHNLHAGMVIEALKAGKKVFVEKPLCLNEQELEAIVAVHAAVPGRNLMVGFNRRFSPFIEKTKEFFVNRAGPLQFNYRINAGYLPSSHWVFNKAEGGGRIAGEICHFVDLLQFIAGSRPISVYATALNRSAYDIPEEDNVSVTMRFQDGSAGTIGYTSLGDPSFPRERLEIFGGNSVTVIDNFTVGQFTRSGITRTMKRFGRDMGHENEVRQFVGTLVRNSAPLIPFHELVSATLATLKISESLKQDRHIEIEVKNG